MNTSSFHVPFAQNSLKVRQGDDSRTGYQACYSQLPFGAILIACGGIIDGVNGMGAKYLPSIKDQKANLRFHQKQNLVTKGKKPSGASSVKPGKKKQP